MIIIPEIETVVILTPRTGSGSLKRAIAAKYPAAIALYRHMEADGVPAGYDRFRRLGVIRHPVERLWSLYKFCQAKNDRPGSYGKYPELFARLNRSVERPFEDWLLNNEVAFTNSHDAFGNRHWPFFTVRHNLPENRKSQYIYVRPDLGTQVFRYDEDRAELAADLDVDLAAERVNVSSADPLPILSDKAVDHIERFFGWDLVAGEWVVQ